VYRQIDKLIKGRMKDFFQMTKNEETEYDSSRQTYNGLSMYMQPTSLYQTEKVISFGMLYDFGYTGMSSSFEFNVINYDLEKKKKITIKDYFILDTKDDSTFLATTIGRAAKINDMGKYFEAIENMNFSFDELYVYFYFDKYELAWGDRCVKKKYILDHINPEYR
jgi:hypothetical protein